MKVFTYSEARQHLSDVLNIAQNEEVEIRRRDGQVFSIVSKKIISAKCFVISVYGVVDLRIKKHTLPT